MYRLYELNEQSGEVRCAILMADNVCRGLISPDRTISNARIWSTQQHPGCLIYQSIAFRKGLLDSVDTPLHL